LEWLELIDSCVATVTGVNGVDGAHPFVGFAFDPATGTVRERARAGVG
jgi:hypothetical protein